MNLYLTNHANVRKTNFCTSEGQILYKSETPGYATRLVPNQKTTISKVIPDDMPEDMADKFTHLATIEWHTLGSSRLTYGGFEASMTEFMPSKGIFAQYRIFTAPVDGRSFEWTLGVRRSTNDGSKIPVARSHRSNIGILGKARQARLEIFPGFEHLVDIILVTYIFVEKLRKDRERDAQRH